MFNIINKLTKKLNKDSRAHQYSTSMDADIPFFDKYDRFYETSKTSPFPHRLNGRYQAIIQSNSARLEGKKVLDIASHDGRWTIAALKAGAAYVKGIEPRQELIGNAIDTFNHYKIEPSRYQFACGDVFDLLIDESFDVVLCLGFFYHTLRHAELLDRIERTGAKLVIIDTEVTPQNNKDVSECSENLRQVFNNPYEIQLLRDHVNEQQMAYRDSLTRDGYTLEGEV